MKDQDLGPNGSQAKRKIHAQGLPDKFVKENVEPETKRIDCEGVHIGVL
jgi:hypothetical protein